MPHAFKGSQATPLASRHHIYKEFLSPEDITQSDSFALALTTGLSLQYHSVTCRFEEARGALFKALGSRELFGVPLLVLANKQDVQDAQPPEAMQQMLGLDDLRQTFR